MQKTLSPEQTKSLQQVSLKMLLYFDGFCRKHQLTYFLCGGCCIGAVRSGGFIPWDDDADVFMPRADYEKLKRLWTDTGEYALQYPTALKPTANQFATISAENTAFIKTYQKDLDIRHGVMLDILPLDGCPDGWRRLLQEKNALLYSLYVVGKAPTNHGKAAQALGTLLLGAVPHSRYARLWQRFEKRMTKFPAERCGKITELCSGPHYMQNEYPKEIFAEAVRVPFEGYMLPVPAGYDAYLRMAFGDYMQLPPEELRFCHHEYEILDTENSYRKYRGVYYSANDGEAVK